MGVIKPGNKYCFKNNLKQQFLVLIPFITQNAIIVYGYSIIFKGEQIEGLILFAYCLAFVLAALPVLILHSQYLFLTWSQSVCIGPDYIEFKKKNKISHYQFSEIFAVNYYATSGHSSKRGSSGAFYTFGPYRFYKILLKDQKSFYVTCLMINDLEHTFEKLINFEAEWHFRALPLLY